MLRDMNHCISSLRGCIAQRRGVNYYFCRYKMKFLIVSQERVFPNRKDGQSIDIKYDYNSGKPRERRE